MRTEGLRVLLVRAAYAVALIAAVGWAYLVLSASAAAGTLGYDFQAYRLAVDDLLAGRSMYDLSATSMGAFGLFFYPPPFALLVLPFALLPGDLGLLVWTLSLAAASVAAVALLPVSPRTRYIVLLLAAFSWPLVYAIKLGQVGSVLLLLFAIAWRWLDRPGPFGLATGLGTVIKLQPGLVIGWAIVIVRGRAAVIGIVVFALLAALITAVAGLQPWSDWTTVLGNVSRPVLAENDMGFGRQAFLAGVPLSIAQGLHYANVIAVILLTFFALYRATPVASFMAVVIASQFVSPVLWDHYALLLLLPVAWLMDRGYLWAALIPLVTSTVLVGITPGVAYPIVFWVTLIAVTWAGPWRRPRAAAHHGGLMAALDRLLDQIALRSFVISRVFWGLGALLVAFYWWQLTSAGGAPVDARWYWEANPNALYPHPELLEGNGYNYSPAFELVIGWGRLLAFETFVAVWRAILAATLLWLAGPLTLFVLFTFPVASELNAGNIQLLLAAAIVLGVRGDARSWWPATWAFVLLTKVTPGVGLLWFAVRRQWRALAVALGVTAVVAAVTFALWPDRWLGWITLMTAGSPAPVAPFYLPFWPRFGLAIAIVILAAWRGWRWPVVVAGCLALPQFYTLSPSMLVGVIPFAREAYGRWAAARRATVSPAT